MDSQIAVKNSKSAKGIHGLLLIITGIAHSLFAVLPAAFGKQFAVFSNTLFFNIDTGLMDFPLFGGKQDFESLCAFFFFYAGPMYIVFGLAVYHLEKSVWEIPVSVSLGFLLYAVIGAYMVPLSGMTLFLLPQAVYMHMSGRLSENENRKTSYHS